MNNDKKKYNYGYREYRNEHIRKNLIGLKTDGTKTEIEEIILKYQIETPRFFVHLMDMKFIDESGEFGDYPDPERKLSLLIGKITSTDEKITYLKAIKEECRRALHDDLVNEQFKKTLQVCNEMLDFLTDRSGKPKEELHPEAWNQLHQSEKDNIDYYLSNKIKKKNRPFAKRFLAELELLKNRQKVIQKNERVINTKGTYDYLLEHKFKGEDPPVSKTTLGTWIDQYTEDFWDFPL